MASASLSTKSLGICTVNLTIKGRDYYNVRLYVLPQLCVDIILGQDFQQQHDSVSLKYGGHQPPLVLSGLTTLCIDPPELFANLTDGCRPIASKSRRYSFDDCKFIENETQRLLREGIIEPSNSPWRAQIVVTKDGNHKKRLAIDYSHCSRRSTGSHNLMGILSLSSMTRSTGSHNLMGIQVASTTATRWPLRQRPDMVLTEVSWVCNKTE